MWLAIASSSVAGDKVYRDLASLDGDRLAKVEHADLSEVEVPSSVIGMVARAPGLQTLIVAGPRFYDSEFKALLDQASSLHTLILDSTDVSDEALAQTRRNRPDLKIHRSQRWAIEQIDGISRFVSVQSRLPNDSPKIRELYGDRFFHEAIQVDFSGIYNLDNSPCTPVLNEKLAPLKYLTSLEQLNLEGTRINDAGMVYLRGLTKLRRLRLPLNEVSSEGLRSIRDLSELSVFAGFPIDDHGLQHLSGLKQLQHLNVSGPKLTDDGLAALDGLLKLDYLSLSSENLHGHGLHSLTGLPNLESLSLIGGVQNLNAIPEIRSLRHLHISGSQVNDASMQPLARCETLQTLWLNKTKVGDEGMAHLKHIDSLRDLSLRRTQVSDKGIEHLKELPELRILDAGYTNITIESLKQFRQFLKLETLILYGLPLDEEGLRLAAKLTRLKKLNVTIPLENNDYEARQAKYNQLRKLLPNCQVH